MLISCKNISKTFAGNTILLNISFLLNECDKCALIGINGAGKTTLFKIITGEITYDTGSLTIPKDVTLGYLPQITSLDNNNTIYDEILTVFNEVTEIENKIRLTEHKLSIKDKNSDIDLLLKEYSELNNSFENLKGYEYKSRVKGVIKGLGFDETEYNKKIFALSGGQKTRIALAKTLLTEPDLLLLDEPTNHLDISAIEWLENFLKNYKKGILVISHDRYFLDNIVNKVIEIEHKKSNVYLGNYTYFYNKKSEDYNLNLKHYENQQKEIKKQEESIRRLKSYNREKFVRRAESKQKLLNKIEIIEKPLGNPDTMNLIFTPKYESGFNVLEVENLSKKFQKILFQNINFNITKGDKVALIGPNGIGKTTLIKIILKLTNQYTGNVKIGKNVNICYYDQEQNSLNLNNTVIEEISNTYPNLSNFEIRSALAAFMFKKDDITKKILNLSGGEKGRATFLKIMLSNANFLILDEPTNHLDLFSKEILENAIRNYKGTILYISHDRYFINNTAEKIIDMHKDGVNIYLGNYDYYIEKRLQSTFNEQQDIVKDVNSKENWKLKKENEAKSRKKTNFILKIEEQIEGLENKIKDLDEKMCSVEISSSTVELQKLYDYKMELQNKLDVLFEEWELLSCK